MQPNLVSIESLVELCGGAYKLAKQMGVRVDQVTRWRKTGAMVDQHGNVWMITRRAKA